MADIDYRGKIAKFFYYIHRCVGETKWEDVPREDREICYDFIDQLLRAVIAEGKVCYRCWGRGTPHCLVCNGIGKLPDITIEDAIKEKLGG